MGHDKNIFLLIVKNSIFIFLKEYNLNKNDDKENISTLEEILLHLEKYAHIPDKLKIIRKNYEDIKSAIENETFQESMFLKSLNAETKEFTLEEKSYLLNSVIFVANKDKHISHKEKESILQIAKALDIELAYKEIIKEYHQSEFYQQTIPKTFIMLSLFVFFILLMTIAWKIKTQPKVQTFNTNKYQFDEITFNRYILYKNKFNIQNSELVNHFKKYAVYYISGKAQISFNPQKITYDALLKTITLSDNFIIDLQISQKNEIDKVLASEISEEEAKKIGVVVGLAGAYGASTINSKLNDYLPSNMKSSSSLGLTLLGGATAYLATSQLLEGAKLTNDISITEKKETLKIGESLIKAQLLTDKKLLNMYKEHFEIFIKAKYKTLNKEVNIINYANNISKEIK